MSSAPFRIKVVLNQFHTDHRAKAYITVHRSWTNVHELEAHIKDLFQIRNFFLTTEDGFWLPPNEHINVVANNDIIIVQPLHHNPISSPAAVVKLAKDFREKTKLDTLNNVLDVRRKRIRTRKRKPKFLSDLNMDMNAAKLTLKSLSESLKTDTNTVPMAKIEQKKNSKWIDDVNQLEFDNKNEKNSSISNTKPFHIRFSEDEDDDNDDDDNSDNAESEETNEFKLPETTRQIEGSYTEINVKQNIENSDQLNNEIKQTDLSDQTNKINSNDTIQQINTIEMPSQMPNESVFEELRTNIMSKSLKNIDETLCAKQLIAFRVAKLNEKYEPEISDFVIATVKNVIENDTLTLHVLAGSDKLNGFLELSKDDEGTGENKNVIATAKITDLFQPKIIEGYEM